MKTKTIPLFVLSLLVMLALACASSAPSAPPANPVTSAATATPDVQQTIAAGMAATVQAQSNTQATVNAAVASTVVAMPPTATPPPPVQQDTLSQEEMEALITQAVNAAVTAADQAAAASAQAAADDSMTSEEVQTVEVYVSGATQAVTYAEELLVAYSSVYGDLAVEALEEVNQATQELNEISASMDELTTTLEQMNATLQQGQAIAVETINQLETTAQTLSQNVAQVQAQTQQMVQQAQQGRDLLTAQIQNMKPDNVPADLQATLAAAFSYVDQVTGLLQGVQQGGQKPSRDQILQLAQLGANVSAGLNQHGGPQLQGLSGKFGELSLNLGRGQFPQAKNGIGGLETSLGQRPAGVPGRPGGGSPGGGAGPGGGGPGPRP